MPETLPEMLPEMLPETLPETLPEMLPEMLPETLQISGPYQDRTASAATLPYYRKINFLFWYYPERALSRHQYRN
jgi:hypothetical protein